MLALRIIFPACAAAKTSDNRVSATLAWVDRWRMIYRKPSAFLVILWIFKGVFYFVVSHFCPLFFGPFMPILVGVCEKSLATVPLSI
jgi:hypothetical protein